MSADIAVIILTLNEEANIAQALNSVRDWASQVFLFDSYSTDQTLEIARQYDCRIVQHRFVDYAQQRNMALDQLPIAAEWVLFLDADERLTDELKAEIATVCARGPVENGFYLKRRLIWMGRWIRRGYYPTWILRLFRAGKGRCEDRSVNEHIVVDGQVGYLKHDFIHEDRKGLTEWLTRHNTYSTHEAKQLFRKDLRGQIEARLWRGSQAERKRWVRERVWNCLPPLLRPFLYFFYRYVVKGGFLDGTAGFIYHFLQALCFMMLIDVKYLEMRQCQAGTETAMRAISDAGPTH
jgi:glycosyltransferase involved in cell wall biosynthesis